MDSINNQQRVTGNKRLPTGGPTQKGLPIILKNLFKPLIDKELINNDSLNELFNVYDNFYARYIDRNKLKNFYEGLNSIPDNNKEEIKKYFSEHINEINIARNDVGKGLGRFTLEALSLPSAIEGRTFQGIKIDPQLKSNIGQGQGAGTRGLFKSSDNSINLNTNYGKNEQDILATLTHEGNHALEYYNPGPDGSTQKLIKDFLEQEIKKQPDNKFEAGYLDRLFRGMQDIIGLDNEFTALYKLGNGPQVQEITQEKLDQMNNPEMPMNPWGPTFHEVPAFALESIMKQGHQWNKPENEDSRRVLKRILKNMHQQYSNLGLVDKNSPQENTIAYRYKGHSIPFYNAPTTDNKQPAYNAASNAIIDKINFLRTLTKPAYTVDNYPVSNQNNSGYNQLPSPYKIPSTPPYTATTSETIMPYYNGI